MKKLRLLQVKEEFTPSEPTYFPEQLRWLSWLHYPFDSLRIDMIELAGLNVTQGSVSQLQLGKKVVLPSLKFINLEYSDSITMFPSVLGVPNLEWLNLSSCAQLVEVHESVFHHGKIIYLNLSYCVRLKIIPSLIKMKSLQTLLLAGCCRLERFPEFSTDMKRLSFLNVYSCKSISVMPTSIRLLTGLTTLLMGGCFSETDIRVLPNLLIQGSLNLSSLRVLDLSDTFLDDRFPINLHTAWPSLEELELYENMCTQLPATISQLSHLKYLSLRYCYRLKELPELPSRIQVLKAHGCTSLEKIKDLSNTCKWLFKISVIGSPKLLKDRESQSNIDNMLMKSLVQKCAAVNHRLSIKVPGSKIPNWFSNQRLGNKTELYLPHNQISKIIGLAMCCRLPSTDIFSIAILFKPLGERNLIGSPAHPTKSVDGVWVGFLSVDILGNLCHVLESENLIISFEGYNIVECGVCVIFKDDIKPMAGTGSWIPDFDTLGRIDRSVATSEVLKHGRWSSPTFSFDLGNTGNHNSVLVNM